MSRVVPLSPLYGQSQYNGFSSEAEGEGLRKVFNEVVPSSLLPGQSRDGGHGAELDAE